MSRRHRGRQSYDESSSGSDDAHSRNRTQSKGDGKREKRRHRRKSPSSSQSRRRSHSSSDSDRGSRHKHKHGRKKQWNDSSDSESSHDRKSDKRHVRSQHGGHDTGDTRRRQSPGREYGRGGFEQTGERFGGEFGANLSRPDWKKKELEKVTKDFYHESEEVQKMTSSEAKEFRESLKITVKAKRKKDIPKPVRNFEEAGFPKFILEEVKKAGFTKPTPIQCQAWPMAMTGRDVIGIADTGSGKTLAFTLPALIHILAQPPLRRGDGPIALVLCPTRELCEQTFHECGRFGYSKNIKSCSVYGGAPRHHQIRQLRNGVHIVVATPGRLIDFLSSGIINLERVTYLVLDEADRMLDMGFEPQLRRIVDQVRPDHQTLFFSATWPHSVYNVSKEFCDEPLSVLVGSLQTHACHNVKQTFEFVHLHKRLQVFKEEIIPRTCGGKCLVFCNTKAFADQLTRVIRQESRKTATAIHGDKMQMQRDMALRQFRKGEVEYLVATDVAQRGLDIKDVQYVINYDLPNNIEDYVHRIGRTGRAGSKGESITFFCPEDECKADNYVAVLKEANMKVPKTLQQMANGTFTSLPPRLPPKKVRHHDRKNKHRKGRDHSDDDSDRRSHSKRKHKDKRRRRKGSSDESSDESSDDSRRGHKSKGRQKGSRKVRPPVSGSESDDLNEVKASFQKLSVDGKNVDSDSDGQYRIKRR